MTTADVTTEETITVLNEHGFTHKPLQNWYEHASGYARVALIDAEAGCLAVYAFTHDRARLARWEVRLYHAPLPLFAATVTAATA